MGNIYKTRRYAPDNQGLDFEIPVSTGLIASFDAFNANRFIPNPTGATWINKVEGQPNIEFVGAVTRNPQNITLGNPDERIGGMGYLPIAEPGQFTLYTYVKAENLIDLDNTFRRIFSFFYDSNNYFSATFRAYSNFNYGMVLGYGQTNTSRSVYSSSSSKQSDYICIVLVQNKIDNGEYFFYLNGCHIGTISQYNRYRANGLTLGLYSYNNITSYENMINRDISANISFKYIALCNTAHNQLNIRQNSNWIVKFCEGRL